MPTPPPCTSLGKHCRELRLTLRISDIRDDSQTLMDAASSWLTGHTERITFGPPHVVGNELRVEATVHVPCKYLKTRDGAPAVLTDGAPGVARGEQVHCTAHGFRGPLPKSSQRPPEQRPRVRQNGGPFLVFFKGKRRWMDIPLKRAARRALPTLQNNPCADAPCRTADNTRGAACCRDLSLELVLPETQRRLEALLRARRSPYLCKVKRQDEDTVECEVISACGYLDDDGISCVLHDRVLPNGRLAKPSLCYKWPELEKDETGHPGCRLL